MQGQHNFFFLSLARIEIYTSVKETTACQLAKSEKRKKFGEYVCVRTRQFGDRTSLGEFRLFCTRPRQQTCRSSFSVNDSVTFLIRQ